MVVKDVAEKNQLYKEQIIVYDFGWGRADLISKNGEVWEVKPNKPNHIAKGIEQINKYVKNTWKKHPSVELSIGKYIDKRHIDKTINFDTYHIDYHYAGNGIIVYKYTKDTDWEKVGEATTAAVSTLLVIAMIVVSGDFSALEMLPA